MRPKDRAYAMVRVKASGTQIPRFLSLLLARGIMFQEAKYEAGSVQLTIPARQYRQAAACAKKTGIRLRIISKKGVAFFLFRHRRRKWTVLLVLPMLIIVGLLPHFVWRIDMEGLESISQVEMLRRLEEAGVYEGMWQGDLDTAQKARELLLQYEDLSWLSLSLNGAVLEVALAEAVPAPEMVDRQSPADVVATQTCVVYSMVTESGTPLVRQGDVVQEGEVLIQGQYTLVNDAGEETVVDTHASGQVFGKRSVRLTESIDRAYIKQNWGAKSYGGVKIRVGNWQMTLRNPFRKQEQEAEMEEKSWELPIGPISWNQMEYIPYTEEEADYSPEEMESRLTERLEIRKAQLLAESDGVLLREELKLEETAEGMMAYLDLILMEEIGETQRR